MLALARMATIMAAAGVLCVLCLLPSPDDYDPDRLAAIGKIEEASINETSAFAPSRRYPGVFWAISDSGNPNHLYALSGEGKLLATYEVRGAINLDWEALTVDRTGRLFIADVGNNAFRGMLYRRWIYEVAEPDPRTVGDPKALRPLDVKRTIRFGYPDKAFDCEAVFVFADDLFLVSKEKETKLYRLNLSSSKEDQVPLVEFVCKLPGVETVTDACLSADGDVLALCSYGWAARYELDATKPLDQLAKQKPEIIPYRVADVESCAWEDAGKMLLLVSENRNIFRVRFPWISAAGDDGAPLSLPRQRGPAQRKLFDEARRRGQKKSL